jgi:Protein of unknown function (DUF3551)
MIAEIHLVQMKAEEAAHMRTFRGIAMALATAASAPAQAAPVYPWCTTGAGHDFGGVNCGFVTFEQCMQTARGNGQHCAPNPNYQAPAQSRPKPPRRSMTSAAVQGG